MSQTLAEFYKNMPRLGHGSLAMMVDKYSAKDIPLFFHGRMGIGKSEGVKAWAIAKAKSLGLNFLDLTLSKDEAGNEVSIEGYNPKKTFIFMVLNLQMFEGVELKGIPAVIDGETRFLPTNLFPTTGHGVIFLDEVNLAMRDVLNNLYSLLLNKVIGMKKMSKDIYLIAAGNRDDDGAYTVDLPGPLKDRMAHYELVLGDELGDNVGMTWVKNFAMHNNIDERIVSYILFNDHYLHTYNADNDNIVFATPRSWTMLSQMIEGETDTHLIKMMASSLIGNDIAAEFMAFLSIRDAFDVEAMFKKPEDAVIPIEPDKRHALMSGIVSYYKNNYESNVTLVTNQLVKLCQNFDKEYELIMYQLIKMIDKRIFTILQNALPKDTFEELFNSMINMNS
jgi:hypothetical protein